MTSQKINVAPQAGPQWDMLASPADIVIFGGEAGGGKSYGLLLEPIRHLDNPRFGGVIFRRTSPQLTGAGSLWEDASELYGMARCKLTESPTLQVEFPSGGLLQFLHLQHEKDRHDHQGKQYAFIGFDELTHFTESQFWYLYSRNRSTSGIRPYMRATTNPDPDSWVRKLIAWWIGDPDCTQCQGGSCTVAQHGYANPKRSGVVRWMTRINGAVHWFDSEDGCDEFIRSEGLEPGRDASSTSVTFIKSSLDDNPALLAKDPGYRGRLLALDEVEKERLAKGNWNVRPSAGLYIKETYLAKRWDIILPGHLQHGTPELVAYVRERLPPLNIYTSSDYAVTEAAEGRNPDWTEHGVWGVDADDNLHALDWWYGQTASDEWIERLLDLWALWKPRVAFGEGGVIAQAVKPALKKRMLERKIYTSLEWITASRAEPSDAKEGFADPSKRAKARKGRSFQARAAMGKVLLPPDTYAPWVRRVAAQWVSFPQGPDDAFDVAAHMCLGIDEATGKPAAKKKTRKKRDIWADKPSKASWKTV